MQDSICIGDITIYLAQVPLYNFFSDTHIIHTYEICFNINKFYKALTSLYDILCKKKIIPSVLISVVRFFLNIG